MAAAALRASGIAPVGCLPWGTHFCEFYRTKQDLIDTLVPFFATGLADNELCIWVTSGALERDEAEERLAEVVPDYRDLVNRGQIELHDHRDWYRGSGSNLEGVLARWLRKEAQARERGFDGLRLTGDTSFVRRESWHEFVEYERTVEEAFSGFQVIGLCTYHMDRCSAADVLDVMRNHQFALARLEGGWEIIEQGSVKVAKAELEHRVRERTHKLEEAVRGRDEFLAMLGHELRNPLAPIRSAAEIVRALGNDDPHLAKAGEILERQAGHMGRLLDDLLDVARITHGRITLDSRPLDFALVAARAVDAARSSADARGHRLRFLSPPSALNVHGDPTRLAQVLDNLLDNAIKYTPRGGRIEVEAREEGGKAVLVVSDNGVGIAAEALTTLFDPFTQGPRSAERSEGGLGLGLAVVRNLIEMHGGQVEARSVGRGLGSTFVVRLPLCATEEDRPLAGREAASRQGIRILLIDDNRDAAESLAILLEAKGHHVHTGSDGIAALRLVERHRPDAVVLDIGLPGIDGFEVARRLRRSKVGGGVRLIAVTGYGGPEDRARALQAGFDVYLVKPIQADVLDRTLAHESAADIER